ncbi:hypothetical protein SynPROSU1_01015 [Synechococcus sp. PROS-U-1]|nr:hypothetical protein SynPROSU1_01015 [Synechococcus sp. PROS-U-1]
MKMNWAPAPLQALGRRNVRGFPRPRLPKRINQPDQVSIAMSYH